MTDLIALNKMINDSGIKKSKMCEALGISYPSLRRRLDGEIELNSVEISIFCRLLEIKTTKLRDQIFFANM